MVTRITPHAAQPLPAEARQIRSEPYYEAVGGEIALFEAAYASRLPVLLKGPTGCGKTRFIEHMAWRLQRPLITVSCHDDLTAADLVGRYLITANETLWVDGPLARAVRSGAICYLDEVVEARRDTTVVIHPLADDRRISYNPGYQSVLKDLKQSTRQRFVSIEFRYPDAALEEKIIRSESAADAATASALVRLAQMTRNLKGNGLDEGASTRLLVHAAKLIARGIPAATACHGAIAEALSDDPEMLRAIDEFAASVF
jgi:nitric oxide reductase NorQ protein